MAAWCQSAFLQALGWAMLNSFWQMALLFVGLILLQPLFRSSAQRRYSFAVGTLGAGFIWFVYTFFAFYKDGASEALYMQHHLAPTAQTWNLILSSASLAYLFLLLVPAGRLVRNWRYVEQLKKFGLQKTAMEYRLFVKKTAQRLGIKHTVHVYLSQLVQSPVTIGYLKPLILLPIAAVNNLSPQQVEAVLLHELSHIKRYDYLINFIVMFLQTLFYFNPFVKKIASLAMVEREKCCDEMVLQFEYDKVSYAAALLALEKNVLASEALALAAANKNHLLHRIEKILGLRKKRSFSFNQFAGIVASFLVVIFMNSLLFINKEIEQPSNVSFTAFENPLYQFDTSPAALTFSKAHTIPPAPLFTSKPLNKATSKLQKKHSILALPQPSQLNTAGFIPVVYNIADQAVTPEEKVQIAQTLEQTKRVLVKSKWKEVETSIGDGLTSHEKKAVAYEYLKAANKIDWDALENRLKTNYTNLDWTEISAKLDGALIELKLDSLQTTYHQILTKLEKTKPSCKGATLPAPDLSVKAVEAIKGQLKIKLDSIDIIRERKIIDF